MLPLMTSRVADGPALADPDAVERPQDRVRQLVLLVGALAKYSDASFWNPYVEMGGGLVSCAPSGVGNTSVDSKTIDELITMIRSSRPALKLLIAASKVEARIRSFSASSS